MGFMTMAVVPSDIRLAWQWALGFVATFAAALMACRFRQRIARVALVAGGAAVAVAGLVYFYAPALPAGLGSDVSITVYTVVNPSRIVVQLVVAAVIAFGVDFFLTGGKPAASSTPAGPVRRPGNKTGRRRK